MTEKSRVIIGDWHLLIKLLMRVLIHDPDLFFIIVQEQDFEILRVVVLNLVVHIHLHLGKDRIILISSLQSCNPLLKPYKELSFSWHIQILFCLSVLDEQNTNEGLAHHIVWSHRM